MPTRRRFYDPTVLRSVTYDDYVRFRDSPRNDHARMTYRNGTLELTTPEFRFERAAVVLGMIVRATAGVFSVPANGSRCTTFHRGVAGTYRGSGKEPDDRYYFANHLAIWQVDSIDLEIHPPRLPISGSKSKIAEARGEDCPFMPNWEFPRYGAIERTVGFFGSEDSSATATSPSSAASVCRC
jgi:hypothetical protein